MTARRCRTREVVVVGGGVIGLSVAWRLAARGRSVAVLDDRARRPPASWVAAGMLAPVSEASYGEERLVALCLESNRRWPAFAADIAAASGCDPGLRTDGTLALAFDDDDMRELQRLSAFQRSLGLDIELLPARACRQREPLIDPRVRGGVFAAGDHHVDNRALIRALRAACARAGVSVRDARVEAIAYGRGAVAGVRLDGGERIAAGAVVVAAGSWSRLLDVGGDAGLLVRPLKGQILRLRARPADPVVGTCVRGIVRGTPVYLVPRRHGEIVVGATSEDVGDDTRVTAGAIDELLRAAIGLVPSIAELELVESTAALRPGTHDNGPIIGPGPLDGLAIATGHHRNGILLAPVTADAVVALVEGHEPPPEVGAFGWERFR